MKIALITNSYKVPTELWIWRQAGYFREQTGYIGILDRIQEQNENGIPVVSLQEGPAGHALNPFFLMRRLEKLEKEYDIDTYYIHYLTNAWLLKEFIQATDKKVFVHCHGFDITHDLKHHQNPLNFYHSNDYRSFLFQLPSQIDFIANSTHTKNHLISFGVPEERIHILYFGTPVEGINHMKPEKPVRVLYLGRLVDFKGPDLTILAFEKACEKGLNGELLIAGDGPLVITCQLIRSRSRYRDRIFIMGKVDYETARKLRSECHIFTAHNLKGSLSNQEEAYGVSIIEAMGAGLPVVTGRSGGVKETVVHGETGYLFEPGDIESHAGYLVELALDYEKRAQLGENAFKQVTKNLTLENERNSFIKIVGSDRLKVEGSKNAVIIGPYRFHNFGDDLIGAIIAKYLQAKKYNVCIPLLSKENADWLKIEFSENMDASLRNADYIVVGGGGIWGDTGVKPDDHYRELALKAVSHGNFNGKGTIITGIGAGPLSMEKSFALIRQTAELTEKIGVRDNESKIFLKDHGVEEEKLVVGADIALLCGDFLKFDVIQGNQIGIQFDIGSYADVIRNNPDCFEIFNNIREYVNENSSKVILISNGNFISQLSDNPGKNYELLIYKNLASFLPVVSGLKAIFTSHLHLAITAYSMRIPCFSLYVREKTRRFYAQINHPERAVDLRYAKPEDFHRLIKDIHEARWTGSDEERLIFLQEEAMKLLEILK